MRAASVQGTPGVLLSRGLGWPLTPVHSCATRKCAGDRLTVSGSAGTAPRAGERASTGIFSAGSSAASGTWACEESRQRERRGVAGRGVAG